MRVLSGWNANSTTYTVVDLEGRFVCDTSRGDCTGWTKNAQETVSYLNRFGAVRVAEKLNGFPVMITRTGMVKRLRW